MQQRMGFPWGIFLSLVKKYALLGSALCLALSLSVAHAADVAFAGFAYSGDDQSIAGRFPYSKRYEASLGPAGINGPLQKALTSIHPQGYKLIPRIEELADRDQAIAVALVITNETVSTEQIGAVFKLFVQLRGQAMYFDFKSQTVIRAYPFSFAYIDGLQSPPTEDQKIERIGYVYNGIGGKPGILERFTNALAQATIPTHVPLYVQVSNISIDDEARSEFPAAYGKEVAETWVADTFADAISSKMGIPILPYAKGYAIGGVMPMTVADGTVFNLKLPQPDYQFSVKIKKLKKILYSEQGAGKAFIYGTLADVKLDEPLSSISYLNGQFKNGELKTVPASQVNTDDFPAFQDSMRGLFIKLSAAIDGEDTSWLKSATQAADIDKQMASTRELIKTCK
ncbi:MAG: hypothetical protein JWP38_3532 [Herbaspirillum sp.]|nr:hypothetical protein [Herbaspirillum sp.]